MRKHITSAQHEYWGGCEQGIPHSVFDGEDDGKGPREESDG
jgi:hypothetical protein